MMRLSILIALAALGVAGCGSSQPTRSGATQRTTTQSIQQSANGSQAASNQSSSGGNSNSTTQSSGGTSSTTQSSAGGSVSQSSSSAGGATINSFTGTGEATIRIVVGTPSRLLWSNTKGERFALHSDDGAVSVDSSSDSGELALPAGSHRLRVSGRVWTVLVRSA